MNTGVAHFQRGATMTSVLIGLIVAGIFFTVAFKLYPPYMDQMTINSIIISMTEDEEEMSKSVREIRSNVGKRLYINQIELPNREALQIRLDEGVLYFDLVYEVRVPMFYNIDAIVKFEEHYEAVKP